MAKQSIGIGSVANDGTGDSLRVAGDKINDNFNEVYEQYTFPFPQFTTATSTTAYTGTPSPVISAYATGQKFQVKIHATSTGAATLNLNSVGAKKVFVNPTTQATTGDLLIDQVYIMVYDTALDAAAGGFLIVGGGSPPDGWLVTGTTNVVDPIIDLAATSLLLQGGTGSNTLIGIDGAAEQVGITAGGGTSVVMTATDFTVQNGGDINLNGSLSAITITSDISISASDDVLIAAGNTGSGHDVNIVATAGGVHITSSSIAITDAASMAITNNKHTLTTSSATRTFTITYEGDFSTIVVTLNAAGSVFTFPAGALCVSQGTASGDNTLTLSGVSGDKYFITIGKYGSAYYIQCWNHGQ